MCALTGGRTYSGCTGHTANVRICVIFKLRNIETVIRPGGN